METLGKLKNVRLYPTGRTLKRPGGRFECFLEAWHLLKQQKDEKKETNETQPESADADVHNLSTAGK